jgi:hypothetical protein
MPYQPGTSRRTGRRAGAAGAAVHLPAQQDVVLARLVEREAAGVVLLDAALDAVVGAGEDDADGSGADAGLVEERGERRAGPFRRADRFVEPRAG